MKKTCHFKVNEAELKVTNVTDSNVDINLCKTESADLLFEVKDVDHQKGKIGFFADHSTKFMVNFMQIVSKNCTPAEFNKPKFIFSKKCSRFNYNLESDTFENLWKFKDDMMVIEKLPSIWREIKDLEFKFQKGIVQEADLKTKNNAIATWLELQEQHVCTDGNFMSMFKVEDEGRLAFVFRKQDEYVFWYVELDLVKRDDKQVNESNNPAEQVNNANANANGTNNNKNMNKPSYLFKVNLKRRIMSPTNAVIEKFLTSVEVAIDILTFKFSTW